MRFALCLLAVLASSAAGQEICINGRCSIRQPKVIVQNVTVVDAQSHADHLAATNTFVHCGRRGGGYEGLGFSTSSPGAACRNACYWGKRPVREIGTAWCPARRGWIACVRYH